jgi:hypothetical protein
MNPQIFNFCSQISLSSLFPTVAIFKKYNTFIQLKNVSSAKYEIENTVCHDDLCKYLTKYANIYIHVNKCNSAMNGNLYNLSHIIRAIDSKGEDMRIDANYKLNDLKVEITEQQTKIFKMSKQMISLRPTVQEFEEENQYLSLLEKQADDLRELISTGEELEKLSDEIAQNISEKIYECLKEDDDISEGLIMLPGALQNKHLDSLLDEIFDDGLGIRCENLDFDDILEFTVSNDKATDLFLRVRIQELETLTSNNNNEDDSVFDEEEEENSEWETQSIDEKENPSVSSDLIGPIPKDWQPEEEEPHKVDECKHCSDYHVLIQELNEKNKKIQNQKEIIDNQDRQIEDYAEKDYEVDSNINEWKAKWLALSDCFDDEIQLKEVKINDLEEIINERDETIKKLREELTRQREKNKNNNI